MERDRLICWMIGYLGGKHTLESNDAEIMIDEIFLSKNQPLLTEKEKLMIKEELRYELDYFKLFAHNRETRRSIYTH